MSLKKLYNEGSCLLPLPGRYEVLWKIRDVWHIILEKTINKISEGQNHLPVFFIRQFNVPFMDFDIIFTEKEVLFKYRNGLIIDKLKKRKDKEEWIGKLYFFDEDKKEEFFGWFIFRKK